MTVRDRILGLTVVVLWGVNFLAIHAGLEHFSPFFFAFLRFAVMAIPVIIFIPRPQVKTRWLLLYGLGFGTGQFAFLFLAMSSGMPTGLASLVLQSSAPFTVILGVLLLRERLTLRQVLGISVAIGGMVVIGVDRLDHGAAAGLLPVLLTLLAGLSWAFGNLGTRLAAPPNALHLALWMSVIPPLPMLAVSAVVEGPTTGWHQLATVFSAPTGPMALVGLAYIVVGATIAGSGLWSLLMQRNAATRVAPLTLLVPIVGITVSWAVLGETPSVWELVGAALVIAGCLGGLMARAPRTAPPDDPPPSQAREPSPRRPAGVCQD